jgi:hypothetical protein
MASVEQPSADAESSLQWQVWPIRQGAPASWLIVLGLLLVGCVTGLATGRVVWALIVLLLLAGATWKWFLPVRYRIDNQGVSEEVFGRTRLVPWNKVGSCLVRHQGIVLIKHAAPVPLDAFGAWYVPWGDRREEVLAQAKRYLGEDRLRMP